MILTFIKSFIFLHFTFWIICVRLFLQIWPLKCKDNRFNMECKAIYNCVIVIFVTCTCVVTLKNI